MAVQIQKPVDFTELIVCCDRQSLVLRSAPSGRV